MSIYNIPPFADSAIHPHQKLIVMVTSIWSSELYFTLEDCHTPSICAWTSMAP